MSERIASCHCGALSVACSGEPRKVSLCHCQQCQRRTGSAFSVAVFYDRAQVAVQGEAASYVRPSASGLAVDFRFCQACGSNLFWYPARMPALVGVAYGGFADPDFVIPDQAVWSSEGHRWVNLPDHVVSFEGNPSARR